MERNCPNCGCPIPEEAAFCMNCFYSIGASDEKKEKKKKPFALFIWLKLHRKKLLSGGAGVLAFLLVMGICIAAMKNTNSAPKPQKASDTTIVVEQTYYTPVTEAGGVAVTDQDGEQVTEVVEITKVDVVPVATTEKQGFFDKLFDTTKKTETEKPAATNGNSTSAEETTKKDSFWDKLFGDDEEETTVPATKAETTEEHGTTESSSSPAATTTRPVTTTEKTTQTTAAPSTTVGTTAVTTTESGSYYFEYVAHKSSDPDGPIALTKYVGNASVVTIPVQIDGKYVQEIRQDCFKNDSKITRINIPYDANRKYIWLNDYCFNNLTSLTTIDLYNNAFLIHTHFAYNCPISQINFESTSHKFIDGAYYYKETLKWFSANPSFTTLTIPDWCTYIDTTANFNEVPNLKIINIHKNVGGIPTYPVSYSDGLKAINVEAGHPTCVSVDGVMFKKTSKSDTTYKYCIYPYLKTDKTFKMPDNSILGTGKGTAYTVNSSLEELWLPLNSTLSNPDNIKFYTKSYPNLKTIHIADGHSQYEKIKSTFKGELIVY